MLSSVKSTPNGQYHHKKNLAPRTRGNLFTRTLKEVHLSIEQFVGTKHQKILAVTVPTFLEEGSKVHARNIYRNKAPEEIGHCHQSLAS